MNKLLKCVVLAMVGVIFSGSVVWAESLPTFQIMTEPWGVYQFEKDGKVQGLAVEFLVMMLARAGSTQGQGDIKMEPWSRGYNLVQTTENTILFSTTRTEEREKMFKWVGPIFQNSTKLIAKKEKGIKISGAADIKKYKVGTVQEDVGEQYLQKMGIGLDTLDRTNNTSNNVKKLGADRIDMITNDWEGFVADAKTLGIDPNLYESVYILNTADIDYAFYKGTPDWVIEKLQKAMDELKSEGKLKELQQKYEL